MKNKCDVNPFNQTDLNYLSFADLYAFKKFARFQRGYFDCTKEQIIYYTNIIMSIENEMLKRSVIIFGKIPV